MLVSSFGLVSFILTATLSGRQPGSTQRTKGRSKVQNLVLYPLYALLLVKALSSTSSTSAHHYINRSSLIVQLLTQNTTHLLFTTGYPYCIKIIVHGTVGSYSVCDMCLHFRLIGVCLLDSISSDAVVFSRIFKCVRTPVHPAGNSVNTKP